MAIKTKYKHIYFEKAPSHLGVAWYCSSNKDDDLMATISYYRRWKKYVIEFHESFVFDESCLRDIANFLDQINK